MIRDDHHFKKKIFTRRVGQTNRAGGGQDQAEAGHLQEAERLQDSRLQRTFAFSILLAA